jgi:hypothetical protein
MRVPTTVIGIDPSTQSIWVIRLQDPVIFYTVRLVTRQSSYSRPGFAPISYQCHEAFFPAQALPDGEITPDTLRGLRRTVVDLRRQFDWPRFENGAVDTSLTLPKFLNTLSWRGDAGVVDLSNPKAPRYAPATEKYLDRPEPFEGISVLDGQRWIHTEKRKLAPGALAPFAQRLPLGFMGLTPAQLQRQVLGVAEYVTVGDLLKCHYGQLPPTPQVETPISMHEGRHRFHVDIAYHGRVIAENVPMETARSWHEKLIAGDPAATDLCAAMRENIKHPTVHNSGLLVAAHPEKPDA